ncbi:squash [Haematobia irritans]|uniref:squash n=1 Tax=Haematobia irritans TaxID=7368 RepID=UPI003F4F664A
MPWKPSNDFEEEIINLQPDHDFVFGTLSEPEPQSHFPRPQDHIEYASKKKRQIKENRAVYEATGNFNNRLHLIEQVQRISGTKHLGQQPSSEDWDCKKESEKEIVSMMRHFGVGPSVEKPLNGGATLASYPVKDRVEVVQHGRKKVPLFFDDNLFKLKPQTSSQSSSGGDSESLQDTNSSSYHSILNNSNSSTNSSMSSNDLSAGYKNAEANRHAVLWKAERLHQYGKLHEEEEDDDDDNGYIESEADVTQDEYGYTPNSTQSSYLYQSSCDQDSFRSALDDYEDYKRTMPTNTKKNYADQSSNQNALNYSGSTNESYASFMEDNIAYSSAYNTNRYLNTNDPYPPLAATACHSQISGNNKNKSNTPYRSPQTPTLNNQNTSNEYFTPNPLEHINFNMNCNNSFDSYFSSCTTMPTDTDRKPKSSFLQRFLKQDGEESLNDTQTSPSSSSLPAATLQPTYANIAKQTLNSNEVPKSKSLEPQKFAEINYQSDIFPTLKLIPSPMKNHNKSSNLIQPSNLKFYTAREVYERRRHALS